MNSLIILIVFVVSAFVLISSVQGRPSFLLLLPIVILAVGIGWYLNKQIQKEHEENLQKGFAYTKDEVDAEHWLHQTFIPKTTLLFKKHIKEAIIYSGIILSVFVFVWSYIVAGLDTALLDVFITIVLYGIFVFYALHADKWYRLLFKRFPRRYRHLKNNDWIHAYITLLPFAFVCFLFYVLFNYRGDIIATVLGIPLFLFVFTVGFVCLYCFFLIYKQYQKDEQKKVDDALKDVLEK